MGRLADAAVLAVVAIGSVWGAGALATAAWPRRSPAAAIALWQALGLGGGLAAVGALLDLGLASGRTNVLDGVAQAASTVASGQLVRHGSLVATVLLRLGSMATGLVLLGVLCWVLVAAAAAVARARRRHRLLLALLARGDPKAPGALVVDYPTAAAYCLPGLRSRIVVSVGALDLLRPAELAAVLEHERAHLREHHDLVLLPFTALRRAFGWWNICARAQDAVALLIEMLADDRALRVRSARTLAAALLRFGAAGGDCAPAGALGASDSPHGEMTARISRLLEPPPKLAPAAAAAICTGAVLLVALPIVLLAFP